MIERLDVTHLLKASNKQYWFGRLDKLGKYLVRIAAYFSGSVCRHRFERLVLNMKLGPRRKDHKEQVVWLA